MDLPDKASLEDLTHRPVAYQIVDREEGFLRAHFLAEAVPAVGYKHYWIGEATRAVPEQKWNGGTMVENEFYGVGLAPHACAVSGTCGMQLG